MRFVWLGRPGKNVLAAFKEAADGSGRTWVNQGVCGVNTADNGFRYYDLTGPGVGTWETGSGGWATPDQPDTPGPNNLWYEGLPADEGPVIKLFTETFGQWTQGGVPPQDGQIFWTLSGFREQILITGTSEWVGDDITVHYRTEGVQNVGVKVEVTLYMYTNDGEDFVQVGEPREQAIAAKWGNNQQITFTVPGNSGATFQFYAQILKADGTTQVNSWIDNGTPAAVTTKP